MQKIYKLAAIIIIVSLISLLIINIKDNISIRDAQTDPAKNNNIVSNQATKDPLNQLANQDFAIRGENISIADDEIIVEFGKSFINLFNGAVAEQKMVSFEKYISNKNLLRFTDKMLELTQKQELQGANFVNYGSNNEFKQSKLEHIDDNLCYLELPFQFEGSGMMCKMLITSENKSLKLVDFYFGSKDGVDTFATGHPAERQIKDPDLWENEEWIKGVFNNLKDITDIAELVTIEEVVNREDFTPNGDKARYIYELPIINIDKPGAQKINAIFLALEKGQEARIGNGQNMTIKINSKAFLNDGIISVVMTIVKPGPGGIYAVNYDIENDREVSTKELLDKYEFNPQKLIAEINKQVKINENISIEERDFISIDDFVYTILDSASLDSSSNNVLIDLEEIRNKTQAEKEQYVIENIDKIQAYLNNDGSFVFVHRAELQDEELVVVN